MDGFITHGMKIKVHFFFYRKYPDRTYDLPGLSVNRAKEARV
jgi:hypothetical protein